MSTHNEPNKNSTPNKDQRIRCNYCGEWYRLASNEFCPYCKRDQKGVAHGYVPISDKKMKYIRFGVIAISVVAVVLFVIFTLQ